MTDLIDQSGVCVASHTPAAFSRSSASRLGYVSEFRATVPVYVPPLGLATAVSSEFRPWVCPGKQSRSIVRFIVMTTWLE